MNLDWAHQVVQVPLVEGASLDGIPVVSEEDVACVS